jgi:hypothetical protein
MSLRTFRSSGVAIGRRDPGSAASRGAPQDLSRRNAVFAIRTSSQRDASRIADEAEEIRARRQTCVVLARPAISMRLEDVL